MVAADGDLAHHDQDREPERRAAPATMMPPTQTMNRSAVGGGVEHLAQLGHLVVAAGDVAVDPVGGAEHGRGGRPAATRLSTPNSSHRNTGISSQPHER